MKAVLSLRLNLTLFYFNRFESEKHCRKISCIPHLSAPHEKHEYLFNG